MECVQLVKRCRVCGDRAIGFNFNGLSCGSCKSFFRRNITKYSTFSCRKGNQCHIDLDSRKCCTLCRLDKCLKIGMREELICFNKKSMPPKSQHFDENSQFFGNEFNLESLLEMNIQKNIVDVDPEIETSVIPFSQLYNVHELNEYEQECIKEVQNAVSVFQEENSVALVCDATDLIYVLNLSEYYIRRTIKFCKSIHAFKCLNQEDQLSLLKGFFADLLIIRLAFHFDVERDGYVAIKDVQRKQSIFIKLTVLMCQANKQPYTEWTRHYVTSLKFEMENDIAIRDLLLVKRLFKHHNCLASSPEFVRYQYHIYRRLLARYLEHKYKNVDKAKEKLRKLYMLLNEMESLKRIVEDLFVEADSNQLALVLNEVFDRQ